jgi:acyl carrier protein
MMTQMFHGVAVSRSNKRINRTRIERASHLLTLLLAGYPQRSAHNNQGAGEVRIFKHLFKSKESKAKRLGEESEYNKARENNVEQFAGEAKVEITLDYVRDLVVELFGVHDNQIDKHELVVKYKNALEQNALFDEKTFLAEFLVTTKIAETFGVGLEEIKPSTKLIEDLGADSLDTFELILSLEEMTKSEIPDDEASHLITASDVINFVKSRL